MQVPLIPKLIPQGRFPEIGVMDGRFRVSSLVYNLNLKLLAAIKMMD
jgi:hypothetical protein